MAKASDSRILVYVILQSGDKDLSALGPGD